MKPVIILTNPFLPEVMSEELRDFSLYVTKSRVDLEKNISRACALISGFSSPVNEKLLKNANQLKVVGNFAVGFNNIDFDACRKRGIRVVNTPGVLSRATAELALTLLLAAARRVPEGEALCRSGKFDGLEPNELLGRELKGRHVVLVGKGRIGKEAARLFKAIGLKIEWITREDSPTKILQKLKRAEVLSLHLSLNPSSHHWLNRTRIAALPKNSIVINTTRGATVDERALITALQKKKIFAAGLDVYEHEPHIPLELRKLPNVVLLPHVGSATLETRTEMARLVCRGVKAILGGKHPSNEVKF